VEGVDVSHVQLSREQLEDEGCELEWLRTPRAILRILYPVESQRGGTVRATEAKAIVTVKGV
jgi:hypothetical protein